MASFDAARVDAVAAVMEVRHAVSRPLKRKRERAGEIRHARRIRLRALRVGGAIPATQINRADLTGLRLTISRELQDLHHTRGRQLRASSLGGALHARQREREDMAALQQWWDKCA